PKLTEFLLQKSAVNIPAVKRDLNVEIEKYPKVQGGEKQYLSNDSNKALSKAKSFLKEFGDEFISLELMILGVLEGNDKTAALLKNAGLTVKVLKQSILELRKGRKV